MRSVPASVDEWVYGDSAPNPDSRDLVGLKARWIVDRLPDDPAPAVLDFGTGEGKHLKLVAKLRPKARLVGVDIRAARTPVDFEFHQVPVDAPLPFADGTFDVVVSCDVLEHVDSIEESLGEIRRVLRQGGSFIGFVPAEGGPGPHGLFRAFRPGIYRETKDHRHAYTTRCLRRHLASRFEVAKVAYSYHLIGGALDAAFFASFKLPGIGRGMEAFWRGQENAVYRGESAETTRSMLGRLVRLANRIAYSESLLLRDCSVGASGLHFHVVKH
jgi:SAM-dependent methyltransferase